MKDISILVSGVKNKAEKLIEKQTSLIGKNDKLSKVCRGYNSRNSSVVKMLLYC